MSDKRHSARLEDLAMDNVAADIADERIAAKLFGPGVAAVNRHASRAGKVTRGASAAFDWTGHRALHAQARPQLAPWFDRTDAENFRLRAIGGDAFSACGDVARRVSGQVSIINENELNVIAIGANEFPSPFVERHPVLTAAGFGTQLERAQVDRKVATAKRN